MAQSQSDATQPANAEQTKEFTIVVKNCAAPCEPSTSDAVRAYTVGMSTTFAIELWRARSEVRRARLPALRPPLSWYLRRTLVRGALPGAIGSWLYLTIPSWWSRYKTPRDANTEER